jgi:siroheme synthase
MGLANIALIVDDLLAAGRPASTPAAIIERGTTSRQRSIVSTIGELPRAIRDHAVQSPALLVIGEVVTLSHELDWFQPRREEAELRYA